MKSIIDDFADINNRLTEIEKKKEGLVYDPSRDEWVKHVKPYLGQAPVWTTESPVWIAREDIDNIPVVAPGAPIDPTVPPDDQTFGSIVQSDPNWNIVCDIPPEIPRAELTDEELEELMIYWGDKWNPVTDLIKIGLTTRESVEQHWSLVNRPWWLEKKGNLAISLSLQTVPNEEWLETMTPSETKVLGTEEVPPEELEEVKELMKQMECEPDSSDDDVNSILGSTYVGDLKLATWVVPSDPVPFQQIYTYHLNTPMGLRIVHFETKQSEEELHKFIEDHYLD